MISLWWSFLKTAINRFVNETIETYDKILTLERTDFMHIYIDENIIKDKVKTTTITSLTNNLKQYISQTYMSTKNTFTVYATEFQSVYMTMNIVIIEVTVNNVIKKITIFTDNQTLILLTVELKTQSKQYILKRIIKKIN